MKAMALNEYGGVEVLTTQELPTPRLEAGEVLVRMRAASINPVDVKARKTGMMGYQDFPVVLGWDIAGIVEALGEGVSDVAVGDEVFGMIRFPAEGRAYAEYVAAPVSDIAPKPTGMTWEEAAATTLAALTAHQNLERMKLGVGQTILVHAAAGGVGHFAVQLAKARGARVIGTGSPRNQALVMSLGADEFVDYHAQPFEQVVHGVDAVLDTVGGDTFDRSFGVVRDGGFLITIASQPSAEQQAQAQQHGIHVESTSVTPSRADMETLARLYEEGKLKPHISQTFLLEQVADAHRAQETGRTVGKIVLTVA